MATFIAFLVLLTGLGSLALLVALLVYLLRWLDT